MKKKLAIGLVCFSMLFSQMNVQAKKYKDEYHLGEMKLEYVKDNYEYDTYEEGQDKFSLDYTSGRNIKWYTYTGRIRTNGCDMDCNIDVKHPYQNHYVNNSSISYNAGKKVWIYDSERTLSLVNVYATADLVSVFNKYVSSIKFEAIDLKTGKTVSSPVSTNTNSPIQVSEQGATTLFKFTSGYMYSVTLPDSVAYGIREDNIISVVDVDLTYHFIVGDIEKVKKLNFPETLSVDAIDKDLSGKDTNGDYIWDEEYYTWGIKSILSDDIMNNEYNRARYSDKYFAYKNFTLDSWSALAYVGTPWGKQVSDTSFKTLAYHYNTGDSEDHPLYTSSCESSINIGQSTAGIRYEDLLSRVEPIHRIIVDSLGYASEVSYVFNTDSANDLVDTDEGTSEDSSEDNSENGSSEDSSKSESTEDKSTSENTNNEKTTEVQSEGAEKEEEKIKAPNKVTGVKIKNIKGKKVKVTFKKQSGCKYQIQTTTNKKFRKSIKKYSTSNTSYTIKKLKKGKTYRVRVRAYKTIDGKKVYGKWSSTKKIKIKKLMSVYFYIERRFKNIVSFSLLYTVIDVR